MFRKLLSRLPFQPSLLKEVSVYKGALAKKVKIRKYALLLAIVGFILQIFIIAVPTRSSIQTHPADTVFGVSTKGDLLTAYRRNQDQLGRNDIQTIFNNYGIAEAQLRNAEITKLNDQLDNYISTTRSTSSAARTYINIVGVTDGGIYEVPLQDWASGNNTGEFDTLTGLSSYGFRFWVLLNGSGNIVLEKGTKKPNLEITKNILGDGSYNVNDEIKYIIKFRNSGDIAANKITVSDTLPKGLIFVSYGSNLDLKLNQQGSLLTWVINNDNSLLGAGANWYYIELTTIAKDTFDTICNEAVLKSGNENRAKSDKESACIAVSNDGVQVNDANNVAFFATNNKIKEASIALDQKVSNLTKQVDDANNTTADPGDILQYTLYIRNISDIETKNSRQNEAWSTDVTDIMEYANITEISDGILSESKAKIIWNKTDIQPKRTLERSFKAQLIAPFPNTPVSESNPSSYNAAVTSNYGRILEVSVNKTVVKNLEQSLFSLPNTSSSISMLIMVIILLSSLYYYIRAKLLVKELEIVHKEYSSGGS